jgi:hypothetical protein
VSIAAETSGTFREIRREKRDAVVTSRGCTIEWRGLSSTSSNVSPTSSLTRDDQAGVDDEGSDETFPLREGPPPA